MLYYCSYLFPFPIDSILDVKLVSTILHWNFSFLILLLPKNRIDILLFATTVVMYTHGLLKLIFLLNLWSLLKATGELPSQWYVQNDNIKSILFTVSILIKVQTCAYGEILRKLLITFHHHLCLLNSF